MRGMQGWHCGRLSPRERGAVTPAEGRVAGSVWRVVVRSVIQGASAEHLPCARPGAPGPGGFQGSRGGGRRSLRAHGRAEVSVPPKAQAGLPSVGSSPGKWPQRPHALTHPPPKGPASCREQLSGPHERVSAHTRPALGAPPGACCGGVRWLCHGGGPASTEPGAWHLWAVGSEPQPVARGPVPWRLGIPGWSPVTAVGLWPPERPCYPPQVWCVHGRGRGARGAPWSPQEPSHKAEAWGPHARPACCRGPAGAGGRVLRQTDRSHSGRRGFPPGPLPRLRCPPCPVLGPPWCGRPAVSTSALVAGLPRERTCCPRTPRVRSLRLTGFSLSQAGSWVRHRWSSRWAPPAGLSRGTLG